MRIILVTMIVTLLIVTTHAQTTPPATQPASAPSPSAPPPVLPAVDAKDLQVLFDGQSLDGWEYDPGVWSIVDRSMHGTGKYGQIFTKGDYGSFRLIVTARVVLPETNTGSGHLGILFWGDRPEHGKWNTAGALQVQPPHGAMWDYRTNKNVKPERVVPRQPLRYHDWHTSEVLANLQTGEVRMAVDGVEIIRYKHPDPSVLKKGPIGMQLHSASSVMEYRDIKVEPDPKEWRLMTLNQ
jgi:hypothetical protein